jgi:hypothetical protein
MASSFDFFLSGDHEAARAQVVGSLQAQGFAVEATPAGGYIAQRGSAAKSLWLGAFAGKSFHVSFILEFFVDSQGVLVARLNRGSALGALKGGAIGVNLTKNAFIDTANALVVALKQAGTLVKSLENE